MNNQESLAAFEEHLIQECYSRSLQLLKGNSTPAGIMPVQDPGRLWTDPMPASLDVMRLSALWV